jgi:hypothetical protein
MFPVDVPKERKFRVSHEAAVRLFVPGTVRSIDKAKQVWGDMTGLLFHEIDDLGQRKFAAELDLCTRRNLSIKEGAPCALEAHSSASTGAEFFSGVFEAMSQVRGRAAGAHRYVAREE